MVSTVARRKVLVVVGTRPEAIKLAPVVHALVREGILQPVLVATSQHREMLAQALLPFGLSPDEDLDVMTDGQTPPRVASEVLRRIEPVLAEHRPSFTVVQGDTTSALAAACASFYAGVPVGHVEAGLRSGRMDAPFPEEFNRRVLTVAATLHFAPTGRAASNLVSEGVARGSIFVTGNTVVDALRMIRGTDAARRREPGAPVVLVTLHRRESFGEPLRGVLQAIRQLALDHAGRVRIVFPVHPNPAVDLPAREILENVPGIDLLRPVDYPSFLELFASARVVVTDSGGVQEEAPSLGVPVLVVRDVTERPELVESGWGRLIGTDPGRIRAEAEELLFDDEAHRAMTSGENPFGDGAASARIARILAEHAA